MWLVHIPGDNSGVDTCPGRLATAPMRVMPSRVFLSHSVFYLFNSKFTFFPTRLLPCSLAPSLSLCKFPTHILATHLWFVGFAHTHHYTYILHLCIYVRMYAWMHARVSAWCEHTSEAHTLSYDYGTACALTLTYTLDSSYAHLLCFNWFLVACFYLSQNRYIDNTYVHLWTCMWLHVCVYAIVHKTNLAGAWNEPKAGASKTTRVLTECLWREEKAVPCETCARPRDDLPREGSLFIGQVQRRNEHIWRFVFHMFSTRSLSHRANQ